MAIAFRSSSSGDLNLPGATTTITLPAGAVATDIVVAVFGSSRAAITAPNVVSAPAGWTAISGVVNAANTTSEVSLYAFWALGNIAALGFTNSQTATLKVGWVCSAFTGVNVTTPIDAFGVTNSCNSCGALTTNAVTIATANAWHLIGFTSLDAHNFSAPSFTVAGNGAPPTNMSAAVLYNTTPKSTGSTGTVQVADTVSDTTDVLLGMPFALRPTASGMARRRVSSSYL